MTKINFQNLPNTTTPVNATNLNQLQTNVENAINQKDMITIALSSNCNCTTIGSYTKVTGFYQYNRYGTRLSFNDNQVVIGAGVSRVKISGRFGWYATTGSIKYGRIRKNSNGLIWSTTNVPSGAYLADCFSEFLVDVQEGDTISMTYYTEQSGDSLQDNMRTYITVEVLI